MCRAHRLHRVLCHVKRHFDVRLRSQVVKLGRLHMVDDVDQIGRVGQITIVQQELGALVRVFVQMLDTARVERGRSTDDAMDFVALFQQELGQVRTVLTRHTCDEGDLSARGEVQVLSQVGDVLDDDGRFGQDHV